MLFKVLGSGHGHPVRHRFSSSILLDVDGALYLLDCGEPCAATLTWAGYNAHDLRAVFVSHMHIDHVSGIFGLIQKMKLTRRTDKCTFCLPHGGIEPIADFMSAVNLDQPDLPFAMKSVPIDDGQVAYQDDRLVITAHKNDHTEESFSFVLTIQGRRIVWTADPPNDFHRLPPLLEQPTDLLISELTHINLDAYLEFLAGSVIDMILFTHILEDHVPEDSVFSERARNVIRETQLVIARDGTEVVLERKP